MGSAHVKVSFAPRARFEGKLGGQLTVLEGEELERLTRRFWWHWRRTSKTNPDAEGALLLAVAAAYGSVWGKDVLGQAFADMETHTFTPDSRKLDLFYQGVLQILSDISEGRSPAQQGSGKRNTETVRATG